MLAGRIAQAEAGDIAPLFAEGAATYRAHRPIEFALPNKRIVYHKDQDSLTWCPEASARENVTRDTNETRSRCQLIQGFLR